MENAFVRQMVDRLEAILIRDGIMPMKPGRKLDALIAEKVMGWTDVDTNPDDGPMMANGKRGMGLPPYKGPPKNRVYESFPSYSTDMGDAWRVVEKINLFDEHALFKCTWETDENGNNNPNIWKVAKRVGGWEYQKLVAEAQTPAHAICLAALKAIGHEI